MYASETDCAHRYAFCKDAVTNSSFYLKTNMFCQKYDNCNQIATFFPAPRTPKDYTQPNYGKEFLHVIEWLPLSGGSPYLTLNQNGYQKKNYDALINLPPAMFEGGTQGQPDWLTDPGKANRNKKIELVSGSGI